MVNKKLLTLRLRNQVKLLTTMIANIQKCSCCQSENIVKNGHTRHGNQRSKCYDCGKTRVIFYKKDGFDKQPYIEKLFRERLSLRGIARVFNISVETLLLLLRTLTQKLPDFRKSVSKIDKDDNIEFDEIWSYVGNKKQERWLWTAISRKTIGPPMRANCSLSHRRP